MQQWSLIGMTTIDMLFIIANVLSKVILFWHFQLAESCNVTAYSGRL